MLNAHLLVPSSWGVRHRHHCVGAAGTPYGYAESQLEKWWPEFNELSDSSVDLICFSKDMAEFVIVFVFLCVDQCGSNKNKHVDGIITS